MNFLVWLYVFLFAILGCTILFIVAQKLTLKHFEHYPDTTQDYSGTPTLGKKFTDMKMRGLHWTLGQRVIKSDLKFTYYQTLQDRIAGTYSEGYERWDRWSNDKNEDLQKAGYLRVDGLYDSIVFWGVPVYLKITGAQQFDISVKNEKGEFIYSQDTAATLHDSMTSNATKDFLRGMNKISMQTMDMQKLLMIVLVGVGLIFGLWMMGFI